jgi:hypothetical protein
VKGGIHIYAPQYDLRPHGIRVTIGLTMAGVLAADSVWVPADRDYDVISRTSPWIGSLLALGAIAWAFSPLRFVPILTEGLWLTFGWSIMLALHLTLTPDPYWHSGNERLSWLCVYYSMTALSFGTWLTYRRFYDHNPPRA